MSNLTLNFDERVLSLASALCSQKIAQVTFQRHPFGDWISHLEVREVYNFNNPAEVEAVVGK